MGLQNNGKNKKTESENIKLGGMITFSLKQYFPPIIIAEGLHVSM
jgi:hypothetical protein